jgi:hypothetical protein
VSWLERWHSVGSLPIMKTPFERLSAGLGASVKAFLFGRRPRGNV